MSNFVLNVAPESLKNFKVYATSKPDRKVWMNGEIALNIQSSKGFQFQVKSKAMLIMRNESTTNQQSLSLSVEMFPVEEWKLSDDFADSVQAQDEYFDLHTFNSELLANIEQDYFLKNQSTIEQLYLSTFSLN